MLPLSLALLAFSLLGGGPLARPAPRAEGSTTGPRLVVLLTPGTLLPEHLERLAPHLAGGLGRFLERGSVWRAGELRHAISDEGPGLASLSTGVLPRRHGIVSDAFVDRERGEYTLCTQDREVLQLPPGGVLTEPEPGGDSPVHLLAPGIGDRLRAARPGARVVSIGGNARAAVLLAGQRPDWALWWDRRAGGFTSSSWYGEELPAWVRAWNAGWVAQAAGWIWEAPAADLGPAGFGPDARQGETPSTAEGALLPLQLPPLEADAAPIELHRLAGVVHASPLIDRFVLDLARLALEELELGADETLDLLCLELAAGDAACRLHGPFSVEAADAILRADRELERFFELLDERLGPHGWLAALAATNGIVELPESLRARGIGARRLRSSEMRRALSPVRDALGARFGDYFGAALPGRELRLDTAAMERAAVDAAEVRALARDELERNAWWVAGAYTLEELCGLAGDPEDPWLGLYRRSFHPDRAPDLAVRLRPWLVTNVRHGTGHGSPYPYDRRVALAFLGPGFEARHSYQRASVEDVLPTLFDRLGIEIDEPLDGRVLP